MYDLKRKETRESTKAIHLRQVIDPEQCEKVVKKPSKDAGWELAPSEVGLQGCDPILVSLVERPAVYRPLRLLCQS